MQLPHSYRWRTVAIQVHSVRPDVGACVSYMTGYTDTDNLLCPYGLVLPLQHLSGGNVASHQVHQKTNSIETGSSPRICRCNELETMSVNTDTNDPGQNHEQIAVSVEMEA